MYNGNLMSVWELTLVSKQFRNTIECTFFGGGTANEVTDRSNKQVMDVINKTIKSNFVFNKTTIKFPFQHILYYGLNCKITLSL